MQGLWAARAEDLGFEPKWRDGAVTNHLWQAPKNRKQPRSTEAPDDNAITDVEDLKASLADKGKPWLYERGDYIAPSHAWGDPSDRRVDRGARKPQGGIDC